MKRARIYDGFEKGKLNTHLWDLRRVEQGAVKFQSKIVRKGKKALKITIHRGDIMQKGDKKSKTSERDEIGERKHFGPEEGRKYSYSFSIFIPKNFPIVSTRLVLAQWKQEEEIENVLVNNPIIALRYTDDIFRITLQTKQEDKINLFKTSADIKERWLDFKFHLKFTRTKFGFVKVWLNKKKIVNYNGITAYNEKLGYPKPSKFYFKMGLYRDRMKEPMTAYFDEFHKKELT